LSRKFLVRLLIAVYRVTSFQQRIILGGIHRRELFIPGMKRSNSSRVRYQSVIALPKAAHQLMKLHFDFYAFVDSLNHGLAPPSGGPLSDFQ